MNFVPTDGYYEVSLQAGLNAVQLGQADKLFSDGLDSEVSIQFNSSKGFFYSDGRFIGGTFDQTLDILHAEKWCFHHKFYVKIS